MTNNPVQAAPYAPGRYAAIDIGTVTCRMLVADIDEAGALHEIDREHEIVNLGEDVDATGMLKPEAMQRAVDAVAGFKAVLDDFAASGHPVDCVVAIATSAARDAGNSDEFVHMLANIGVNLSIIPGTREAALSFAGASSGFEGERLLVVDIGGGSTEVILGDAGCEPERSHSFNIGCRRVTEKFLVSDPPSKAELEAARAWIKEEMSDYFDELRTVGRPPDRLVAVAGTATSVVSVYERMDPYDKDRVHHTTIDRAALDSVYEQLRSVPVDERRRIVGLDPGRAPVIVAGLVILQCVLDLAQVDAFTASETDNRHGAIFDAAARRSVEL